MFILRDGYGRAYGWCGAEINAVRHGNNTCEYEGVRSVSEVKYAMLFGTKEVNKMSLLLSSSDQ